MRPLAETRFGSGHVLPSAPRQEAVVSAGDQLRFISERDLVGRLDARPLVEHAGARETAVCAPPDSPVDLVTNLEIGDGPRSSVAHEHAGVSAYAIRTGMTASPVRIDRPAERHPRLLGDAGGRLSRRHLLER